MSEVRMGEEIYVRTREGCLRMREVCLQISEV